MSVFSYEALDSEGQTQKGAIEADSPRQARSQLREKGWIPLLLKEIEEKRATKTLGHRRRIRWRSKASTAELALITRQMDESELRVVKGITAPKYRLLKTCICVLPTSSQQLNLNTLKPDKAQVLAALLTPHLSLRQAKQILLARPEKGWRDLNEVFRLPELDGLNVKIQQKLRAYLTLSSDYFMLRAQINMSRGEDFVLNSLLARQGSGPFYVLRHQSGELE